MPLQSGTTTRNGRRVGFYRDGEAGKMYTYIPGSARSRAGARQRARRQQAARKARGG